MPEYDLELPPDKQGSLLIWDLEGSPPTGNRITILWQSFNENAVSHSISIPKLVEKNAEHFRARFLSWVYELGKTDVNGKKLVDLLELRPGFSYWWMTSIAQKFNASETSQINNAIKLFALEDWVSDQKVTSIDLVSENSALATTLRSFCKKKGFHFEWRKSANVKRTKLTLRLVYRALPALLQALICYLWYLLRSLSLIFERDRTTRSFEGNISFIDVLVHLDRQALATGKFISNYWTSLVDVLSGSNVKTNWFHNYFYQESIPSLAKARDLVECFNANNTQGQFHQLMEENLSVSVFIKGLRDFFIIWGTSYRLPKVDHYFLAGESSISLWPLFKREWIDSFRGNGAIVNCLRVSLYEKVFKDLPHQKLGVYIQENQPWEMALIYAWKKAGHGRLVGVPHTTVRFWDLRYFYDCRSYGRTGNNVLPMPDLVAVNGPVAKNAYVEGGYSETEIIDVEALRYLHLLKHVPPKYLGKNLRVLACGDFLAFTNTKMLSWLSIAAQSLPATTVYILKPHPAYSIDLSDHQSLKLEITNSPLTELLAECDIVFTSNITSAAVDAYCSGIPVVQMLDGNTFNMSPLRGMKGVMYVTNPMELADALLNARHRVQQSESPYFFLNEQLTRWRQLFDISIQNG